MKKILYFILLFPLMLNGQTLRLPYQTLRQTSSGDTLETKVINDSVYFRTNNGKFIFNKNIQVNSDTLASRAYARAAGGGVASLNSGLLKWIPDSLSFWPYANHSEAKTYSLFSSNTTALGLKGSGGDSLVLPKTGDFIKGYRGGSEVFSINENGYFWPTSNNTSFGYGTNVSTTSGETNTAIGFYTFDQNETGSNNTAIGSNVLPANVSGNNNTAIGVNSGLNNTASNNIFIGYYSGAYSSNLSNRLFINSGDKTNLAGDSTKSIIYGLQATNTDQQVLRFNVGQLYVKGGRNTYKFNIDSAGKVKAFSFNYDTTATAPTYQKGVSFWDDANHTISTYVGYGVTYQAGQEMPLFVQNNSGSTIPSGKLVYIIAAGGETPRILLADNRYIPTAYMTIGMTTSSIAHGGYGFVNTFFKVHDLNTAGQEGKEFWLGTSGDPTYTYPTNAHIISCGSVLYGHSSNGIAAINIHRQSLPQFEVLNYDATDGAKLDTLRGLILKGKAKVWNDIAIGGFALGTAAAAPVFTTGWSGSSAIGANYFQGTVQNDIAYFNIQIPHNASASDSLRIHLHWGPTTTPVSTDTVVIRFTYSFSEIGGTFPSVTQSITKIPLNGLAQWSHNLTNILISATGTGTGISGIYNCSIERLQDNTSDTYTSNFGLLSIDAHAKIDRLGSNEYNAR